MSNSLPKILFIGYGNPGRLDDGLGPALAARIEALSLNGVTVEADYQLAVENAFDVSMHDIVIFADAAVRGKAPFFFKEIHPRSPLSLRSHSVSPEAVLFFAERMFHSRARAYVLGIQGYQFNGYNERLSERAEKNLEEAFQFVTKLVQSGNFDRAAGAVASCSCASGYSVKKRKRKQRYYTLRTCTNLPRGTVGSARQRSLEPVKRNSAGFAPSAMSGRQCPRASLKGIGVQYVAEKKGRRAGKRLSVH